MPRCDWSEMIDGKNDWQCQSYPSLLAEMYVAILLRFVISALEKIYQEKQTVTSRFIFLVEKIQTENIFEG